MSKDLNILKEILINNSALNDSKNIRLAGVKDIHNLFRKNSERSLKTTERLIKELGFFPNKINRDSLLDENFNSSNSLVKKFWSLEAKKKRATELYLQISSFESCKYLFIHDGRGTFNWTLYNEETFKESLPLIFQKLIDLYAGSIFLWPHGELVKEFRSFFVNKDSENLKLKDRTISIPISAYRSSFRFDMSRQNKFFSNVNTPSLKRDRRSHLDLLEAESIHIIREVAASSKNPVMLYSLGKDSSVMLHLAQKAFFPGKLPFPLLHVDTKWKFQEMYDFRDEVAKTLGSDLIVYSNQEGVKKNINPIDQGSSLHTNIMKTEALRLALDEYKFDFAFGGARRDEEKSRAKERIFSLRSETHAWDPKNQRPELWNKYNCKLGLNENVRVFPLSNWTELDIWHYIYREKIKIVPLYFAALRPTTNLAESLIMVDDDRLGIRPEDISIKKIRFRTLGCYPLSGAIESEASDLESVIKEIIDSNYEEREGRTIDKDSDSSMEKKKKEGYF